MMKVFRKENYATFMKLNYANLLLIKGFIVLNIHCLIMTKNCELSRECEYNSNAHNNFECYTF
jgi:hypothetical protein